MQEEYHHADAEEKAQSRCRDRAKDRGPTRNRKTQGQTQNTWLRQVNANTESLGLGEGKLIT